MERTGEKLRRRREELGLSLQDVADATKFRPETIQAIEEGRAGVFPAEAYFTAFLRAYASVLGLDPVQISREQKSEEERAQEAIKGISLRPPRKITLRRTLVYLAIVVGAAAVLLVVLDLRFYKDRVPVTGKSSAEDSVRAGVVDDHVPPVEALVTEDAISQRGVTPAGDVILVSDSKSEVQSLNEEGQSEIQAGQIDQSLRQGLEVSTPPRTSCLEVVARKGVQLTLASGDSMLFDGFLTGGDRKVFNSDEPYVIISLSDRGAVSLVLDGQPIKLPPSQKEQVYEVVLPADPQ